MFISPTLSPSTPYIFKEENSLFNILDIKDPSIQLARLECMLKWGVNVNETETEFNLNFLQKCILEELPEELISKIISLLHAQGIDVNHQALDGCTALHFAICDELYDVAKILLAHGANLAIMDKRNETAYDDLMNLTNANLEKINQREEMLQLLKNTERPLVHRTPISNELCLTKLCKTSKEAVRYIIDYQLTSANLKKFPDFDNEDLRMLSENCPLLKELALKSIKFSEASLIDALAHLIQLETLDISWCIQITGEVLTKCQGIVNLNISGCRGIFGSKFIAINKVQNLKLIWLSITAAELEKVIEKSPNIQSLNVSRCRLITDDDIAEIIKKYSWIQITR